MTHGTESRYKKVITSVIGWCIFFNICKFDKLKNKSKNTNNISQLLETVEQTHLLSLYVTLTSNIQIKGNKIYKILNSVYKHKRNF